MNSIFYQRQFIYLFRSSEDICYIVWLFSFPFSVTFEGESLIIIYIQRSTETNFLAEVFHLFDFLNI